ncbi:hypothetical protein SDC9_193535 [bioreactor metagenome]|uniref:Uncharacterized protein n=1 Tax=bioreactor metagenome TaxID=1076179 RepID=A0A645I501_9ZZZZ
MLFHKAGQLGAVGGFARALKAHQHHHRGRLGGNGELGAAAAHQGGKLLIDNFDNHLGGGQALQHIGANRPLGDPGDKVLYDLKAHVGLQKGQADFPHDLLHVGLGQPPLAPQALKGGG